MNCDFFVIIQFKTHKEHIYLPDNLLTQSISANLPQRAFSNKNTNYTLKISLMMLTLPFCLQKKESRRDKDHTI
jgi:hypothetical protein